jgi:hypothetical protein
MSSMSFPGPGRLITRPRYLLKVLGEGTTEKTECTENGGVNLLFRLCLRLQDPEMIEKVTTDRTDQSDKPEHRVSSEQSRTLSVSSFQSVVQEFHSTVQSR